MLGQQERMRAGRGGWRVIQERESGLDQARDRGCGEKWVDPRGRAEGTLRAPQTGWVGRQEEVSLAAFCSVATRFLSS